MSREAPRRFTLADMMILIAVSAVGILIYRLAQANISPWVPNTVRWKIEYHAAPFVMMIPVALLIARAIPPRPSGRRVFRQPGTVACIVAVILKVKWNLYSLAKGTLLFNLRTSQVRFPPDYYVVDIFDTGWSIGLVWLYLVCAGLWNPEASWIDRAGRLFGATMITISLMEFLGF